MYSCFQDHTIARIQKWNIYEMKIIHKGSISMMIETFCSQPNKKCIYFTIVVQGRGKVSNWRCNKFPPCIIRKIDGCNILKIDGATFSFAPPILKIDGAICTLAPPLPCPCLRVGNLAWTSAWLDQKYRFFTYTVNPRLEVDLVLFKILNSLALY